MIKEKLLLSAKDAGENDISVLSDEPRPVTTLNGDLVSEEPLLPVQCYR
jgi:hypothetical protein